MKIDLNKKQRNFYIKNLYLPIAKALFKNKDINTIAVSFILDEDEEVYSNFHASSEINATSISMIDENKNYLYTKCFVDENLYNIQKDIMPKIFVNEITFNENAFIDFVTKNI